MPDPSPEPPVESPAGSTVRSTVGLRPETVLVQSGRPPHEPDQPLNTPVTMAATYVAGGALEYGRYANPTWTAFEETLAALEGGSGDAASSDPAASDREPARCLSYASGMAAVAALLDLVGTDATVVLPRHAYQGSLVLAGELESRGRLRTRLVDIADTDAVVAACHEDGGAALAWIESPTNPALEVADIPAIAAAAHEAGAYVVCDNTFATPLLQRPLDLGADVVLHSATKYLAGHSDLLMGAVVTRDPELHQVLLARRSLTGAVPGAFEAWLALRGLRTLHLRVERAQANAQELVARLGSHPAVREVRYPGLGGIVAIVLDDALTADLLCRTTSLWVHATSLGGVESSFERRRRWASESRTIPEGLVRMSVGVEDVDDLWADLSGALDALPARLAALAASGVTGEPA